MLVTCVFGQQKSYKIFVNLRLFKKTAFLVYIYYGGKIIENRNFFADVPLEYFLGLSCKGVNSCVWVHNSPCWAKVGVLGGIEPGAA
jgi:hypothetical protein